MFPMPGDAGTPDNRRMLLQRLHTALGRQRDLLSALNSACACGKDAPISIMDSIDIILDAIPQTEARLRDLNPQPVWGKGLRTSQIKAG